jgi:hypothetical protein
MDLHLNFCLDPDPKKKEKKKEKKNRMWIYNTALFLLDAVKFESPLAHESFMIINDK